MLVQVTDAKGRQYWVNPLYVRSIVPKGDDACDIQGPFGTWGSGPIRVKKPAAEVADMISAAMPDSPAWSAAAALADAELRQQQANNAAAVSG